MKIAVNRPSKEDIAKYKDAWIGWEFNLSVEAIIWLIEKESECLSWVHLSNADFTDRELYTHVRDEYYVCKFNFKTRILKEDRVYYFEKDYWKDRSHPDLIEIVEKLGESVNAIEIFWPTEFEKSNGDFAGGCASAIKLIEIPNDILYYIKNCGDYEEVHEDHRIW